MIHHVGYVVEDLTTAMPRFQRDFGTGSFTVLDHIDFDKVTYEGAAAVYDHSSAFAAWGSILVELTEVHEAHPPHLRRPLGLGHVAWLADDLAAETERLERAGLRAYHAGRSGPVSAVWFQDDSLGHAVEVLQRCQPLLDFYAQVKLNP